MRKILRKLKTIYNIVLIKIQERCKYGVKYLYFKKNSDTLIIVFSAFPPTNFRLYNYIKSFKNLPFDRLYVKDIWGYKGSYYLMEDGSLFPFEQTLKLIQDIFLGGVQEGIHSRYIQGRISCDYIWYEAKSRRNIFRSMPILHWELS